MKNRDGSIQSCIHCHKCQKNCKFLTKYGIDIGDEEKLRKLAYHCFLCGRCTQVCPMQIDGRAEVLKMRQENVQQENGSVSGYSWLLLEKKNYLFKNYSGADAKSVIFPGCNFPSFYPKTTRHLVELLHEKIGAGVAFDCCGKPVAELGLVTEEKTIIQRIQKKIEECGIEEMIMLCPNCYDFLSGKLKAKITMVYDVLTELGIGEKIEEGVKLFPPCPQRERTELLTSACQFISTTPEQIEDIQCCGLGGCAAMKERELAKELSSGIQNENQPVYTYCATCAGNFHRNGSDVNHILPKILGTDEQADISASLMNRAKMKFFKMRKKK